MMISVKSIGIMMIWSVGIVVLGAMILVGCSAECNLCPDCPRQPNIIQLQSGTDGHGKIGECPVEVDSLTLVTSNCGGPPQPALIWGGTSGGSCQCVDNEHEIGGVLSHPISSPCTDAIHATFTRAFELPEGIKWARLELAVAADDWAEIYLNDFYLGIVELSQSSQFPAAAAIFASDSGLFSSGTNTLKFIVGNGVFPDFRSRTSDGDCFWLEYSGTVEYGI